MRKLLAGLLAGTAMTAAPVASAAPDYETGAPRGASVLHCSEGAFGDAYGTRGVVVLTPEAKLATSDGELFPLLRGGYARNPRPDGLRDPRQACTLGLPPR